MLKWTFLFLLVSCQPLIQKIKVGLGLAPEAVKKEEANTVYVPPPSPTVEQDMVIKVDPRQKFFSLLDGYIREPDQQLKELILEEFKKFNLTLNDKLDPELSSALQKLKFEFSNPNPLRLLLMYQLSRELKGENKDLSLVLLAQGFEIPTSDLLDIMAKKSDDKNCDLIVYVQKDIDEEAKKMILSSRYNNLQSLKELVKQDTRVNYYLEVCLTRLKVEYQSSENISAPQPTEQVPSTNDTAPSADIQSAP